jgi:hypothetical protein
MSTKLSKRRISELMAWGGRKGGSRATEKQKNRSFRKLETDAELSEGRGRIRHAHHYNDRRTTNGGEPIMNMQEARQTPVGMTNGQFKALTNSWKYDSQELLGLNKESASELLDACAWAGHKLDAEDYAAFKEAEVLQDRSAIEKRGFLAPVIIDRSLDRLFSDLPAREKEDEYELRQELKQVNKTMSEAAEYLGRVLTGYKQTLPYKKWLPFLELIGITPRSAQRYMEASRRIWDLPR